MNQASALDTPLWKFSLAIYGRDGVSAECIALQDGHGVFVNPLLFCAFAGAARTAIVPESEMAALVDVVRPWQTEVIRSIRTARRAMKGWATTGERAELAHVLRETVKAAELDAERFEQVIIWDWANPRFRNWPKADAETAISANIRRLLTEFRVPESERDPARATPSLMRAAITLASGSVG